jgi:RHS repeat-associated protein
VHGSGVDEPLVEYEGPTVSAANRRYYHADHQGSVIAEADVNGNALRINTYDPYGVPATGNATRFQYTGQIMLPDLGLYHYKARIYNPKLGRFMQTDPIGYKDDLDLYTYVGDDPMNKTDPSGKVALEDFQFLTPTKVDASAQYWADRYVATNNFLYTIPGVATALVATHHDDFMMVLSMGRTPRAVGSPEIKIPGNPAGARAALENAGYKGTPTQKTSESGTIHTVPGKDGKMDVRVMDGGSNHPPRAVTTREGTNDPVRPDGSRFKNNESKQERRDCSHIKLDKPC